MRRNLNDSQWNYIVYDLSEDRLEEFTKSYVSQTCRLTQILRPLTLTEDDFETLFLDESKCHSTDFKTFQLRFVATENQ